MILFLFTASYPYDIGAEQTFLADEVSCLKEAFDRVILVPGKCEGERLSLPDGVEVDESYSSFLAGNRIKALSLSIFSPHFFADIFSRPSILLNSDAVKRLMKFISRAAITRRWIVNWFRKYAVNPRDSIFYTYWFDDAAMGIGLAKKDMPEIRVISRAHGYDLYEERFDFAYWPRRSAALALMDRIFTDSDKGLNYLQTRYPEFQLKYQSAFLGVKPAGFTSTQSQSGKMSVVSCSWIVPVKRVGLLLEGIAAAARLRPDIQFTWHHFGNGDTRQSLQERAKASFPENAHAVFAGYTNQQDLFNFYRENPVDVFVNVSESEGTPVAIMEAISCGVPVIATSVGGNVEIVSEKNGILLPASATPEEIAQALINLHDAQDVEGKRKGSLRIWQEKYNAERNFQEFAALLKQIRRT